MDIELYTYYYDSLQTLLHIRSNIKKNPPDYSDDYTRKLNTKWLLKQLFSNTNCKYCDFDNLLKNHHDLCTEFLHDHAGILSRNGFEVFSHHKSYMSYLTASKFFDKESFNKLVSDKVIMHDYKQIVNPDIIDMFLDHGASKSIISLNPNLSQANIDKILLEPNLGKKMGYLYCISKNNSFEYDGLKYNFKLKNKTELFKYISDNLIDIDDYKTFIKFVMPLYDNADFAANITLDRDRLSLILDEKLIRKYELLSNKSLTVDLLEMIIEKNSIEWIMSTNAKYLLANSSIPLEYKKKLNEQYYKELVFK